MIVRAHSQPGRVNIKYTKDRAAEVSRSDVSVYRFYLTNASDKPVAVFSASLRVTGVDTVSYEAWTAMAFSNTASAPPVVHLDNPKVGSSFQVPMELKLEPGESKDVYYWFQSKLENLPPKILHIAGALQVKTSAGIAVSDPMHIIIHPDSNKRIYNADEIDGGAWVR